MEVSGKVAVVTGAAAGTGRVIALTLAGLGARVVVADIDAEGAAAACAAIAARSGAGRAVTTDVCDARGVAAIAAAADSLGGGPHILVNNAGGWGTAGRRFPEATTAEWGAVLDLNLRAPMALTQRFLGPMAQAGTGAVVNISSSAGRGQEPYASPEYAAAKAGLIRFSTSLGGLRETMGVRVNCIVPDWIGLDRAYAERDEMPAAERDRLPPLIPPETVAAAVVRLVRDDSLAGRVLVLPGGASAGLL
jgi:NAD(P)-dependent dehydrogenase (short-subunit alcohol dehydrogenase family)